VTVVTALSWLEDTRASYDTVAASYADQVRGAVAAHQYLRAAASLFAESVRSAGDGPVADIGCGPGHVTAHLRTLGVDAFGVDLSPEMVKVARRDHPGLRFEVGSMTSLSLPEASVAGIVAWQSLIHIPDEQVQVAFAQFHRVMRPAGPLQLLFHMGHGSTLKTDGYGGHPMNVRVHRRQPDDVATWLEAAGFDVEAEMVLSPRESASQAFLFARRR
jgi:SAM-dependent methyltransferase